MSTVLYSKTVRDSIPGDTDLSLTSALFLLGVRVLSSSPCNGEWSARLERALPCPPPSFTGEMSIFERNCVFGMWSVSYRPTLYSITILLTGTAALSNFQSAVNGPSETASVTTTASRPTDELHGFFL